MTMIPEAIHHYSREKNLSLQDAAQTFLQVIVLKQLDIPRARFMGGTALVLGYGNPRFSEDVDLTQVSSPLALKTGLAKAAAELKGWFASPVTLTPPKAGGRTWRLIVRLGRAESLRLHVDSQEYAAYTVQPIVIQYPSIPSFVIEALSPDEIMAEKIIAVAFRPYLGGRDLFDLWFHWLRTSDAPLRQPLIRDFVKKKLQERRLDASVFLQKLQGRLSHPTVSSRVSSEWKRYLPSSFQRKVVFEEILSASQILPGVFS